MEEAFANVGELAFEHFDEPELLVKVYRLVVRRTRGRHTASMTFWYDSEEAADEAMEKAGAAGEFVSIQVFQRTALE